MSNSGGFRANGAPTVSVIVPAYRAGETIGAALDSILASGLDPAVVEVVLASDDGSDYSAFVPAGIAATLVAPGPVASGPSQARNRALDAASGTWIAFLDADDTWEHGYLSALLGLAQAGGLAFGSTSILSAGREILRLPGGKSLDFAAMARSGASFLPLLHRSLATRFEDLFAEDILHTAELLSRVGGRAPVSDAAYLVNLRTGSLTSAGDFASEVDRTYAQIVSLICAGQTRIAEPFRQAVAEVFEAKRDLNARFMRQSRYSTYYEFLADHLAGTGA